MEYTDALGSVSWTRLLDLAASPASRLVVVTDALGTTKRFYRIVTPQRR